MGAKQRDISEYILAHPCDRDKAEQIHRIVTSYRDELMTNHLLQDVLLNDGYELPDDERPKSFLDLGGAVFNRSMVILHLTYLETMIDHATRPKNAYVSMPVIDTSGETGIVFPGGIDALPIEITTAEGHDLELIEMIQRGWFENTDVAEVVRKYHSVLNESFDEFNMQYVLLRVHHAPRHIMPDEETEQLAKEMKSIMDNDAFTALDSAYYNLAMSFMREAGGLWEKLNDSEYGRFFRLTQEEVHEGMSQRRHY
ncbi:hypothetical protein KY349_04835 [Candidatus Woesearchaeota archaeon]|nr:hypothetical protein [Candidatus Woesearchaeota archaeon]